MKWKQPPLIKIYEALGAVADDRIRISGNTAKVCSSSGNKFYTVSYDPALNAIMANDNGSYWKNYLGYPSIAFLLKTGALKFKPELAGLLEDIKWKDINHKLKNDFDKTLNFIESSLSVDQKESLTVYVQEIDQDIKGLDLIFLGEKITPPEGY